MRETPRNPKHGQFKTPEGYTDMGFINGGEKPEVKKCQSALRHRLEEFDNSLYMYRCTDVINICHECKIFWHVDMSD